MMRLCASILVPILLNAMHQQVLRDLIPSAGHLGTKHTRKSTAGGVLDKTWAHDVDTHCRECEK